MDSGKSWSWLVGLTGWFLFIAALGSKRADNSPHPRDESRQQEGGVKPLISHPAANSIPTDNSCQQADSRKDYPPREWWEKWGAIAQVVIAFFTVCLFVVSYFQVRRVQQNFRADQRPWIYADGHVEKGESAFTLWSVNNQPVDYILTMPIQMSNVGKSPAMIVAAMPVELRIGPKDQIDKEMAAFKPPYSLNSFTGAIPQNLSKPVTMGTSKDTFHISFQDFYKISTDEWHAYIVGAIKYRDTFEPRLTPYETVVCVLYNPNGMPVGHVPWCGYMH